MAMRFEVVLKSSIITGFALLSQGILSRIVDICENYLRGNRFKLEFI